MSPFPDITDLETKLLEAHAKIHLAQETAKGFRTATVLHVGPFEVRLTEALGAALDGKVRFWIELFDHDRQLSINSAGNCDLGEALRAAEELIEHAMKLSDNLHAWRRST